MTQAISVPARRFGEFKVVAPVCAAHFLSHYYMIMLAPLFAFVRADYGVSYTDLALALTVFNVVSAVLQTPAGFLVDRIGARFVLMAGVAIGTAAFAVAGIVHSFVVFIAMYAVAGLGNAAYHPADYSLLSHHSAPARIGQVFSFHTFAGMLGAAVAPATLLVMQSQFGWRGAYIGAALLGFAVLVLLAAQRPTAADRIAEKRRDAGGSPGDDRGWRLLLSPPIILSLCFFILISTMGGLNSFLVVALGALYGTPDTLANIALTGLLLMNALGVLVGGVLASRTARHAAVAGLGLAFAGIVTALVGVVGFSSFALVLMTSLSGLFVGIASPSRDMLVRAVTPHNAFGRVFGFVSSGFNIGSMIAPTIYGMFMDHGEPRAVFLFSAACSMLCIATVVVGFSGRGKH
ncbi:MAG TPA: MFS transporter [Xanthobacteraceae bacterium]|nr:MFS transporter [Xanthobacteraceae bacterium]